MKQKGNVGSQIQIQRKFVRRGPELIIGAVFVTECRNRARTESVIVLAVDGNAVFVKFHSPVEAIADLHHELRC